MAFIKDCDFVRETRLWIFNNQQHFLLFCQYLKTMVDIVPNSQEIIGHGSFSIVYKARLEAVSFIIFNVYY